MDVYECYKLWKEGMKRWHDKFINHREFWECDLVLLFNSHLKLFLSKLRSRWSGPFKVLKVYPYRAIEIGMEATMAFKVNASRLKHYIASELIEGKVISSLPKASSS